MENHGGKILTGDNSLFIHHSSLEILPPESSNKTGGTGEGNYEFGLTK
jgi:hypothetical protein